MAKIHELLNVTEGEEFLIGEFASLFKIQDGMLKQRQQENYWVDIEDTKVLIQLINGDLKISKPQKSPWTSEEIPPGQKYYFIDVFGNVQSTRESDDHFDALTQVTANRFSSREYAEKIAFKQTLERVMQRFSDENGGQEIGWGDNSNIKFYISVQSDRLSIGYTYFNRGNYVYFRTREAAEQAIVLFGSDIKKAFA